MPHWKRKFEYKWKVGEILMTTRDITFEGDIVLEKGAIVRIYSRNQGYNCVVLRPTMWGGIYANKCCLTQADDLREIHDQEWITILNPKKEANLDPKTQSD